MVKPKDYFRDEKSASGRQLVLLFLAAVAVCAVFFSLGFVVGYNHTPSKGAPATETENLSASGEIPPTVNPPAGASDADSPRDVQTKSLSPTSASVQPPERPQPLAPQPAEKDQHVSVKAARRTAPQLIAKNKPAAVPQRRPVSAPSLNSSSHFAVQVMASKARTDAENLVNLLKTRGYPVYIVTPEQARTQDNLYRVQVGPFITRVAADATRDKLEGEGFRPFVVH